MFRNKKFAMKNQKSILSETPFKYKFTDEDTKKSTAHFCKLGNNAAKLGALKASLERGKKSC